MLVQAGAVDRGKMAEATFSSDRWVRDADLEGQKDKQTKQKKGWRSMLALTYSAIGVIYGDVGTSPLYVFPQPSPVTHQPTQMCSVQ